MALFNRTPSGNAVIDPAFRPLVEAALDVYEHLGRGFEREVYCQALGVEWEKRSIRATDHPRLPLLYKGTPLSEDWRPASEVEDAIVVEVAVEDPLLAATEERMVHALRMANKTRGLLLNFGGAQLQYRRYVSLENESD